MEHRNILELAADDLREEDVIYDWNAVDPTRPKPDRVVLFDETLRDGLQSPSAVDPPVEDKIRLIHLMDELGVAHVDIGLPGAGPRAREDVELLAREIRDAKLAIRPAAAARTMSTDIQPIIDISQRVGIPVEVMAFIGSSTIRIYAEQWSLERLLQLSADAIDLARRNNLPCTYVTEDTVRSHPEVLRPLFLNAIEHGAVGLCLCDTVGHATPDGVRALVRFTQQVCREAGVDIRLDWHGHNDRGLAVENSLWAAEFGVHRVHGCALGLGERVGNAALDQLLLNMKLLGWIDNDLTKLVHFVRTLAAVTHVPIPCSYPLVGGDAFRTGTGVHAAALIKAQRRGDAWLADRIYSGVPASVFGRKQEIEVGPMSGESNVVHWLTTRGVEVTEGLVRQIFDEAKRSNRLLSKEEIWQVINEHRKQEPV